MFKVSTEATNTRRCAIAGGAEVVIDASNQVLVNGELVTGFSTQQRRFLVYLADARGTVRTVPMLLHRFYPDGTEAQYKIFKVIAHHVRCILGDVHPDAAKTVQTVWGRGFVFGPSKVVSIPLGRHLSLPPQNCRWVPSRKAHVVSVILTGRATVAQILQHYTNLSHEELLEWLTQYEEHGKRGLRLTRTQEYASA
ncbi:MAG: DUF1153 domain-containing protein [Candidatus Paceibacterota bacterium]